MTLIAMPYAEWKQAALHGKAPDGDILLYKDCGLPDIKMLDDDTRRVRIRMSTASVDRDNDTIAVDGWDTRNYEKNPVVLYGHNYFGLPVGKAVQLHKDAMSLSAVDEFVPREIDAFADTVYQMLKHGFLNTASVGFRQLEYTINEERRGVDFIRQELLEHSIVPVPANPEAIVEARGLLGAEAMQPLIDWCEKTLDTWQQIAGAPVERAAVESVYTTLTPTSIPVGVTITASSSAEPATTPSEERLTQSTKGVSPRDVSRRTAPQDAEWARPIMADFTEEAFDTLSAADRRRIAGHFAWAEEQPPAQYQQLKLPHHRAEDGWIVWRGVTSAMAALLGARGGVQIPDEDRRAVYDHLASHYEQFDTAPPEFRFVQAEVLKYLGEDYQFDYRAGKLAWRLEATVPMSTDAVPEASQDIHAWLDSELATLSTPDPLETMVAQLRTVLPTIVKEAVQQEMISVTGRLPD